MKNKKHFPLLLFFFVPLFFCPAEEPPKAILEYADDLWEITAYDFQGNEIQDVAFGTELLIGFALQTGHSTAELRLKPNGSILKIGTQTFIKLLELQGLACTKSNRFALISGQVRFVAAQMAGENYAVETPSAVLGVRGTDFYVETSEKGEAVVYVEEGVVEVYNPQTKSSAKLQQGEALEARQQALSILKDEMEEVRRRVDESAFDKLDPSVVPRFDFGEYYSEFEYFKDIEAESYREFFTEKDYFADYQEYIRLYREYYETEMENFSTLYRKELEELNRGIQEVKDAYKSEQERFQEYLQNQ
ncbi:MAG: FecR domain-containing protein [Spirochaetales bacterium]|nr:FecR domain-containing protein [Spirochaetales bacterium]